MVWIELDLRSKPHDESYISQELIESTTEISSLEGTSPRETASTSAHRVPSNLIADYGRKISVTTDGKCRSTIKHRSHKNRYSAC